MPMLAWAWTFRGQVVGDQMAGHGMGPELGGDGIAQQHRKSDLGMIGRSVANEPAVAELAGSTGDGDTNSTAIALMALNVAGVHTADSTGLAYLHTQQIADALSGTTKVMNELVDQYGQRVFTDGPVTLYRLRDQP